MTITIYSHFAGTVHTAKRRSGRKISLQVCEGAQMRCCADCSTDEQQREERLGGRWSTVACSARSVVGDVVHLPYVGGLPNPRVLEIHRRIRRGIMVPTFVCEDSLYQLYAKRQNKFCSTLSYD